MRKTGGYASIATFLMLFAALLSACGSSSTNTGSGGGGSTPTAPAVTVALVTDIGGLNDQGFNHLAYLGYTKAMNQYHFASHIIQTQSQNDYVHNLTLAAQSAQMVIAVGFLMQTPLYQVAQQFPNVKFAIVDGCAVPNPNTGACQNLPNVAPLFFKEQEAGCLVGAIAGQMEVDGKAKVPNLLGKNTISAVGGLSIPPVNRYIAGYKYCAQKVDPSINVLVNYSQDFSDTAKCKDVALSQINQHSADIIFQVAGGCGVGALDAAYQKNVYGIGVDADQSYVHPDVITSALKRVDVAVYDIIDDAEKGTYSTFVSNYNSNPASVAFDIAHDGVGYATPTSAVPADAAAKAMDFENQIKAGTLVPPTTIP
ncbi:MAG TPA: BMP family ABC transporter substrate-binding protein [Ktedonobacteraceae bacterium]|nr:BMP family ABC transporter substrate-binding protein [Ktedonobacteraceae bacterium]